AHLLKFAKIYQTLFGAAVECRYMMRRIELELRQTSYGALKRSARSNTSASRSPIERTPTLQTTNTQLSTPAGIGIGRLATVCAASWSAAAPDGMSRRHST